MRASGLFTESLVNCGQVCRVRCIAERAGPRGPAVAIETGGFIWEFGEVCQPRCGHVTASNFVLCPSRLIETALVPTKQISRQLNERVALSLSECDPFAIGLRRRSVDSWLSVLLVPTLNGHRPTSI